MFEADLCLFWLISEALGSPNQWCIIGLCKVGLFLVGIVYILDFLIGRSQQGQQDDAEGEAKMKEEQEDLIVKGASLGW